MSFRPPLSADILCQIVDYAELKQHFVNDIIATDEVTEFELVRSRGYNPSILKDFKGPIIAILEQAGDSVSQHQQIVAVDGPDNLFLQMERQVAPVN